MRKLLNIITIFIFILLTGCSKTKLTLQPLEKEKPIVAFGDSLTAGYGTSDEYSYPTVLAQISGYKVINSGISGETTSGGLARFEKTLKETNPSLVILMEGGNDILQNIPSTETEQNLLKMINIAKSNNVQVLLIGIPQKSLIGASVASFYNDIAKQTKVAYDAKTIPSLIKKNELKSDLVHFNQQGYAVVAQNIYDDLKVNGAIGK